MGEDEDDASTPLLHHRRPSRLLTFTDGDPECPYNWPSWKKVLLITPITLIDLTVSFGASGYSPAIPSFESSMHVSHEVALLGLSLYILGLAFGPMTLAPLSEYYGRSPIYVLSYAVFLLFLLGTALVRSLAGFLALRVVSGMFAAVTIANFGGTIADVLPGAETGTFMAVFLWAATAGSPMGNFLLSFVVAQQDEWRGVFWALLGICGACWVGMCGVLLVVGETKHDVLLLRRLQREKRRLVAQGKGDEAAKLVVPAYMRRRGPRELWGVALARPFRFLAAEAIIQFGALYNGYLYGLSFLFNGAFALVFKTNHGFDTLQVGLSFLGIVFGISCGPFTNILQERYFQRRLRESGGKNVAECRVQMGKLAAIVFPASLFWFAWTTYASIHPVVPILASAFWGWSFYTLILMTYQYTEDAYKHYAASALAGIGLIRNLAGAGFPLFGEQMFEKLGFQKAGILIAGLACALVPIPFVLERYGRELRKRSPFARAHVDDDVANDDSSEQ